jgi:hypothetical protein
LPGRETRRGGRAFRRNLSRHQFGLAQRRTNPDKRVPTMVRCCRRHTGADALKAPYPANDTTTWPVAKRVGNLRNNDPSLIEPIAAIVA